MKLGIATYIMLVLLAFPACSDEPSGPKSGSESHWLECESDDDCRDDWHCIANRCEREDFAGEADASPQEDASPEEDDVDVIFIAGGYDRIAISGQAEPELCVEIGLVLSGDDWPDNFPELERPKRWRVESASFHDGECAGPPSADLIQTVESISGVVDFEGNRPFEHFSVNLEFSYQQPDADAPSTARLVAEDVAVGP